MRAEGRRVWAAAVAVLVAVRKCVCAEREEMDGGREPVEKMREWRGGGVGQRGNVWDLVAAGE